MDFDLKCNEKTSSSLIESLNVEEELQLYKHKLQSDEKLDLEELIEGHLILGFFVRRPDFGHLSRLFTLMTIVLFERALEEALISTDSNIVIGEAMGALDFAIYYINNYFVYTILAIIAAVPIEAFMIASLSFKRKQVSNWATASFVVGILVMIISAIGIFFMSPQAGNEWNRLWAVSFMVGILLEVSIIESFFMFARYFFIQSFGHIEK
ncbi:unnamed protein product [Blepharisma stoltei]|uniref:Uncharacterized protein n=1 Tax=Blepharisma stoltei TaxID=1481888 RepID=A0AAU9JRH0_9CILI|nr:unnamed protein product [Blepharisma stoltei]